MWIEEIRKRASGKRRTIILPEGYDPRVRAAAGIIEKKKIAGPVLLNEDYRGNDVKEKREHLRQAAVLLSEDKYDGMVAGAANTTSDVLRAAIKNTGLKEGTSVVSSFFLMEKEGLDAGERGGLLFADCAVVPAPDARKLADIAHTTAISARKILGWEPRVAFLSFSTKGSSDSDSVLKVRDAVAELKKRGCDFIFDGELQLDAAVVPEIASGKDPSGNLKGRANVLIFPDLNSGNIGYKIAQRLGNMRAIGPIMQGFRKPVNDLSRGCSAEDIADVAAFTVLQSDD
ncbi:MAG: phosphate acetyltransferase [Elusimicrobia bacterium]|nr:phosphate acetyltransferase [Elusimicrobiota bacterium]